MRFTRPAPTLSPATASPIPTSSAGRPTTPGALASSRPYAPTHSPSRPPTTSPAVSRRARRGCPAVRP
ncbi:hypothetical protein ACFQV2_18835 [Actinokineospora soli]|uniref:Uncharacterized protein n=1 Tax=Actinokineospora soli TaxID=1048753 RepID=A0ABW2TN95_9PSEU